MRLGFIGTGVITEAIITGVVKSEYPVSDIFVFSSRPSLLCATYEHPMFGAQFQRLGKHTIW